MANRYASRWRVWALAAVGILLGITLLASALPLIRTDTSWVRYADFPRLQFAVALVILLPAFLVLRGRAGRIGWVLSALVFAALVYHASRLSPYIPLRPHAAASVVACAPENALSVMVANVKERNETSDAFLKLVGEVEPDVLLIMETDPWWDRQLTPLADSYPHREQFIPEGHGAFGMHLLSKLPLVSPEFRFLFDAYSPTLYTGLQLHNGTTVQFVALHPHPPMVGVKSTTLRDGHILSAALEARANAAPTILAGDFNAVPWEDVTRRADRIAGLLDPRIGRGNYSTFKTNSIWMSWPLDQILYQDGFGLVGFEVLPDFGSDHFPVLARLCQVPPSSLEQTPPALRANDLAEAEAAIEAAKALQPESRSQ
ncbi:endonuclease/exonuclease/phosphatase family protein [Acuticoccus sp. MNP-M23]|uniref:endonuclease/exonuclease/phosphatase family protein n=1 Tax=Acuticoccus sp. MNP-M23 TaxID=3072793 RepID=UPI002814DBC8|nr:endonuclease/exonuclease/phosphatase family protein [Acuticoccus sp. MNP-M23]WMS41911.1 endonuclease/exonuclease/phosphatase family protein [Acuticoccus sp. MNP-M23]